MNAYRHCEARSNLLFVRTPSLRMKRSGIASPDVNRESNLLFNMKLLRCDSLDRLLRPDNDDLNIVISNRNQRFRFILWKDAVYVTSMININKKDSISFNLNPNTIITNPYPVILFIPFKLFKLTDLS